MKKVNNGVKHTNHSRWVDGRDLRRGGCSHLSRYVSCKLEHKIPLTHQSDQWSKTASITHVVTTRTISIAAIDAEKVRACRYIRFCFRALVARPCRIRINSTHKQCQAASTYHCHWTLRQPHRSTLRKRSSLFSMVSLASETAVRAGC